MSNGECSECGALGEVIDGMCYSCYEQEHYDGHCPCCDKLCDYDDLDETGICGHCYD